MKKTMLRKVLLATLFAALLACCLIVGIAAAPADDATAVTEGYVARIGDEGTGTYYTTLADAIAAAPENGTITMIADTALDASLNLTKSITLAGKGVISTSAKNTHTVILAGSVHLTVTGNVEIKATGSSASAIYQSASADTEVTLSGNAKVTCNYWAINYDKNNGNNASVKVTISENAAVSGTYGITINTKFLPELTITGGTITATSNDAVYVDSTAENGTTKIKITGGAISAKGNGMIVKSRVGKAELDLLGGSITSTGNAAVWLNPIYNKEYSDCILTIDGATLTGAKYALSCQGYDSKVSVPHVPAYMTMIIRESDSGKPTVLKITDTKDDKGNKGVIRMVDGSQVDLRISGGTLSSPGAATILYASNNIGYTKLTLTGGYFRAPLAASILKNNGRNKFEVFLSGKFGTGSGQTGDFGTTKTSIFNTNGGNTIYQSTADIQSTVNIFRAQYGTQDITINGGTLDAGSANVIYNTYTGAGNAATVITIANGSLMTTGTAIRAYRGGLTITMTGGSISAGVNCVQTQGAVSDKLPDNDCDSTLTFTGGTLTSAGNNYGYIFNLGNACGVQHFQMKWGGTAKATAANADNGYFIVLCGKTLLDMEITGGTVNTRRASIHLDSKVLPTAERPFTAVIRMSGGTVSSGEVALNIKNTCLVDFEMTGGTLGNKNQNTAAIRNDNVINAATDLTYASRIVISGTANFDALGSWIWAQNGAMDITFKGSRVYTPVNGMIRISGGKSGYASTVTMEGGICVQPEEHGGYVFYNGNKNASFVFPHGFTAYGGRGMIINYGKGPATTLPGSNPDAIYAIGAPVMTPGASARIVEGSNGLRFISHIDAATVAQILTVADAGTVSYGTLIFPASYLNGLSYYTHDTIQKYLDIKAKNGLVEDGEGGYRIRAAIVNIKEENYERDFVAIAYAKYETNGVTHYRYSAMQILLTSRNIRQVAASALADTSEVKTEAYSNLTEDGVYSRYTEAQRKALNSYHPAALKTLDLFLITGQSNGSGYSNISPEFRTDHPEYTNGFSNVLYSGYACSGYGSNPYRWGTLTPVPTVAGYGKDNNFIGAELGLAEMLSNVYNEKTGRTAAILKYADGGTFLADYVGGSSARQGNWTPPSYLAEHGKSDPVLSGNLYRNFIILAEQTVAYYRAHGYTVNASGMFWMQGEAERNYYNKIPALGNEAEVASPTVEQVNALYTTLFKTLVSDTRKDIGNILGEDASTMPVIAGSICESFGVIQNDNQSHFVEMQAKMVSETEHTYILPATRYLVTGTNSGDNAHYSVDDMVFAGNRLGAMFLTLYGEEAAIPAPAENDYVAEVLVNGVSQGKYTNLGYAINTAPENATVKLLRNITLYGPLNIALFRTGVVVDGNGFTVDSYSNGHAMKVIGKNTDITLHNFRLINHRNSVDNAYGIYMYEGATLNITGSNSYFEAYRYGIVINLKSTVNISGGTFTTRNGQDINSAAIFMGSASTLNISGGTFKGINSGAAVFLSTTNCTATITGGTFTPGANAQYAIYSKAAGTILNVSGANITKGTVGSVYNANTTSGTKTY